MLTKHIHMLVPKYKSIREIVNKPVRIPNLSYLTIQEDSHKMHLLINSVCILG
jgi:hypothetical protein